MPILDAIFKKTQMCLKYFLHTNLFILKLIVICTILGVTRLPWNYQSPYTVQGHHRRSHLVSFFNVHFLPPSLCTLAHFLGACGHSSLLHPSHSVQYFFLISWLFLRFLIVFVIIIINIIIVAINISLDDGLSLVGSSDIFLIPCMG